MAQEHGYGIRNLISDGKNTCSYTSGTTGAVSRDPLLYTQAQVDALVKAVKEQVSPSTRPCCANCTHWDGRPYNWNTCRGTKGATTNGDGEIRTHAHFLCVEYRPLKGEPVTPAMFSLDAKDNLNEEWHEKTAASWRDTLEGK